MCRGWLRMNSESVVKISISSAYIGAVLFYIRELKELNSYLIKHYSNQSSLSLLQHNDWQPTKYFIYAVVFIIIGGFFIYLNFKWIRNDGLEPLGVFLHFVIMFVILILEIDIVKQINVPIFQAILSLIIFGGIVVGALSSK